MFKLIGTLAHPNQNVRDAAAAALKALFPEWEASPYWVPERFRKALEAAKARGLKYAEAFKNFHTPGMTSEFTTATVADRAHSPLRGRGVELGYSEDAMATLKALFGDA